MGTRFARLEKEVDKEKILCQGPFAMSVTINWKTATKAEKNACLAECIDGLVPPFSICEEWEENQDVGSFEVEVMRDKNGCRVPDYLHSVDTLLPWVEKCDMAVEIGRDPCTDMWGVILSGRFISNKQVHTSPCDTLAEALAIALLRANGVEVLT